MPTGVVDRFNAFLMRLYALVDTWNTNIGWVTVRCPTLDVEFIIDPRRQRVVARRGPHCSDDHQVCPPVIALYDPATGLACESVQFPETAEPASWVWACMHADVHLLPSDLHRSYFRTWCMSWFSRVDYLL